MLVTALPGFLSVPSLRERALLGLEKAAPPPQTQEIPSGDWGPGVEPLRGTRQLWVWGAAHCRPNPPSRYPDQAGGQRAPMSPTDCGCEGGMMGAWGGGGEQQQVED